MSYSRSGVPSDGTVELMSAFSLLSAFSMFKNTGTSLSSKNMRLNDVGEHMKSLAGRAGYMVIGTDRSDVFQKAFIDWDLYDASDIDNVKPVCKLVTTDSKYSRSGGEEKAWCVAIDGTTETKAILNAPDATDVQRQFVKSRTEWHSEAIVVSLMKGFGYDVDFETKTYELGHIANNWHITDPNGHESYVCGMSQINKSEDEAAEHANVESFMIWPRGLAGLGLMPQTNLIDNNESWAMGLVRMFEKAGSPFYIRVERSHLSANDMRFNVCVDSKTVNFKKYEARELDLTWAVVLALHNFFKRVPNWRTVNQATAV